MFNTSTADFSGISSEKIWVGSAIQKALIKVFLIFLFILLMFAIWSYSFGGGVFRLDQIPLLFQSITQEQF